MTSLAEMCAEVIENFYEVSSLTDAVIHFGRPAEGDDLPDLLDSLLGLPSDALDDLVETLGDLWFDYSSHEHKYGEDPSFIERSSLERSLSHAWQLMEESLRYEARYLNPTAANLLEDVFGAILDDRTNQGHSVVVELGTGSEYDTLYRARVFQTLDSMEKAFEHPQRNFGPPPPGLGSAGRMNAKGVPVFYGATKPDIAISEVRPPAGSHVVVAQFKVIRPLKVLDLRQLGTLRLKPESSLFDPETVGKATRIDFLRVLTRNIVKPVVPELEDHRYVVTQAIADFLATHPRLNLDGIIFPSAQHPDETDRPGSNVILFNKASGVLYSGERYGKRTHIYLFEYDEDTPEGRLEPSMATKEPPPESGQGIWHWSAPERYQPALELDLDAISIFEIKGVKYDSSAYLVNHSAG
nr:RES family NAD+ phosphorylase [Pseudomonas benzenivorans]